MADDRASGHIKSLVWLTRGPRICISITLPSEPHTRPGARVVLLKVKPKLLPHLSDFSPVRYYLVCYSLVYFSMSPTQVSHQDRESMPGDLHNVGSRLLLCTPRALFRWLFIPLCLFQSPSVSLALARVLLLPPQNLPD